MKEYIKMLIRRDGELAAGKIAEDVKAFILWLDDSWYFFPSTEEIINEYWKEFQDEILNK